MTAMLVGRAAPVACIALLLVSGAVSSAFALDAFWQGRRSQLWEHGVAGGVSNWYSKRPLQGKPRDVPDGAAIFATGARRHQILLVRREPVTISSLAFLTDTRRYSFEIPSGAEMSIVGDGVFNYSPKTPEFLVRGKLAIRNSARLRAGAGRTSALIVNRRRVEFYNHSRGGNAEISNDSRVVFHNESSAGGMKITNTPRADFQPGGGTTVFRDRSTGGSAHVTNHPGFPAASTLFEGFSSAERMTITNLGDFGDSGVTGGETSFSDRSTGGDAHFVNYSDGILSFADTRGPAGNRVVTAGSIYNVGRLYVGLNKLVVREDFRQEAQGGVSLRVEFNGARHGSVRVEGKAILGGSLWVSPFIEPGFYKVLYAEGGRTGNFDLISDGYFGNGRLAYSDKEVNLIVDP